MVFSHILIMLRIRLLNICLPMWFFFVIWSMFLIKLVKVNEIILVQPIFFTSLLHWILNVICFHIVFSAKYRSGRKVGLTFDETGFHKWLEQEAFWKPITENRFKVKITVFLICVSASIYSFMDLDLYRWCASPTLANQMTHMPYTNLKLFNLLYTQNVTPLNWTS